jgi:CHAT domain-containing protein
VTLVEFAMLPDRVLAWVLVPGGGPLSPVTIRATPGSLLRHIRLLRTAVERRTGERELRNATSILFEDLIRPLLPHLPASASLVFVPDRSLAQVPFSALFDARRGRYLIEDHPIAVAPSATLYIATVENRSHFPRGGSWNALAIGDPAFDPRLHPGLARLPEAAAEALEVAELHPGSESLRGQAATRKAFLAAAGHYRLLHFAGHAILDPFLPGRSHLILAASREEGSDALYADELAGLKLEATELVVLSACRTVGGTSNSREALTGLSTAFLAAGPPVVVASLWDVEDRGTNELMRMFHYALRQDGEPAAALRTAQLQFLRSPDPTLRSPASWAGFVAMGGSFPTFLPSGGN